MKRKLFVTIFFLILYASLFSQDNPGKFQVGIIGGPALTTVRFDPFFFPSKYTEAGIGGTAGVAFRYFLNDKFGIKTNLSYERITVYEDDLRPMYWWNYLVLPLLAQVNMGKANRFYAEMGPFFGLALSMIDQDYYHAFNGGVTLGLGAEFPVSNNFRFSFGIRDNLGFYDISNHLTYPDKHGDPVTEVDSRYTNSAVILIGIWYDISKR
jgi:hypothetical protein